MDHNQKIMKNNHIYFYGNMSELSIPHHKIQNYYDQKSY